MTLNDILERIPSISTKRNYWLVRTNGGVYYPSFMNGNFIAIGYNKISLEDVKSGNTNNEVGVQILSGKIKEKYGEEKQPTHGARQLLKFVYEIKRGDIVMIPSDSSSYISFGVVQETKPFNEFEEKFECKYIKRKRIKWLKTVSRNSLDPNLYKLMFSHHTITEANVYAEYIDKILNSFFLKDDHGHLVIHVEAKEDIKANSLFHLGSGTLELFDAFCEEQDLDYDSDDFEIKIAVESPGYFELVGVPGGIVIIGIILVALAGGGFDFKYKDEIIAGIKSDGLVEKIGKFLTTKSNIRTKRKLLEKHSKHLQIKDPKELIEILKELDKK